jgi:uncharacterized protein DUF1592/uncharacterized protein DUF1588/uncharacterized protein DUF1595/uncharacterized protein DUF1585/uncharacterized protein DUF1587
MIQQMRRAFFVACLLAFACGEDSGVELRRLPARVRRLSVREYVRTMDRLLGITISEHRFLEDSLDLEYDNGPVTASVQLEQADMYERVAWEIADAAVRDHRDRLLGPCGCKEGFFAGFVMRVLRRPPTAAEQARYLATFDQAQAMGGDFDESLRAVTATLLQSPAFLYRSEIGSGDRLDSYEIASQLSFFLTGLPPDDELLAAAASGKMNVRAQAERLLRTDDAREQFRHFFDQWLATWQLGTIQKDGRVYPRFDGNLLTAMRNELDQFYEYVVFDSPGRSLHELFDSPIGFVDDRLADHYGMAAPGSDTPVRVDLDPNIRRGVLTRAGFLTVQAGYDNSNPITRGVFVRTALLCAHQQPPPPGIPRVPPGTTDVHTTRERFAEHVANPFCLKCHDAIDGVGFGFESFDAVGAYRTTENGSPVDASGKLMDSHDEDGPFSGVMALEQKLAASRTVADCFVRQMFRNATGAAERPEDEAFIGALLDHFDAGTPFVDLAVRIVTAPQRVTR